MLTPDEAADRMREMSRQLEALEEITPMAVDDALHQYAAYFRQRAIPPEPKPAPALTRPPWDPQKFAEDRIETANTIARLKDEWDSRPRVILEGK